MKKIITYIISPGKIFRVLSNRISYFINHRRVLAADTAHNKKISPNKTFILILREGSSQYNQHFLDWVEAKHPEISQKIWLSRVPGKLPPLNNVSLLIPWFQDPLRERDPELFACVRNIEDKLIQQNRTVINPVSSLSLAIKSSALKLLSDQRLRTAQVVSISDPHRFHPEASGLRFPFIIRDDIGHGNEMFLVRTPAELNNIAWGELNLPIALEFINTLSPDGYYRKYRMMVIGDTCLPRHLLISKIWNIRLKQRITDAWALKEERQFVEGPHEGVSQLLIEARRILGFDVVAFDLGIDHQGGIVIWEPNPFPMFWFERNEPFYSQNDKYAIEKIYEALLQYYLKRSGISASPA